IYAGDIENLSLLSTFPQFYQVEQKYRSLIIGMKKSTPPKPVTTTNKPKGQFLTLTTGLQSLIDAIEEKLESGSVYKGIRVDHIEKMDDQYKLSLSNDEVLMADSVLVATPHHVSNSMFDQYAFFDKLKDMPSTSVATVAMAFP